MIIEFIKNIFSEKVQRESILSVNRWIDDEDQLSHEYAVSVYPWQVLVLVIVSSVEYPQYKCSHDAELSQLLQCAWKATETFAFPPKAHPNLLQW